MFEHHEHTLDSDDVVVLCSSLKTFFKLKGGYWPGNLSLVLLLPGSSISTIHSYFILWELHLLRDFILCCHQFDIYSGVILIMSINHSHHTTLMSCNKEISSTPMLSIAHCLIIWFFIALGGTVYYHVI